LIGSAIARRYAKALLSIGQEDGNYSEYGRNLQEFDGFCRKNVEFYQVLCNQLFSVEERKAVLDAVIKKAAFSRTIHNFLRLLLDKNRMSALGAITENYVKLTDEISNVTRADIITARPLKPEAQKKLEKALARLTSKTVRTKVREDASLIGGLIVKIGDLVLDGSVKAQLQGLKESLKRGGYN
jgi:F-type H+-transporting ATPase subunit delta